MKIIEQIKELEKKLQDIEQFCKERPSWTCDYLEREFFTTKAQTEARKIFKKVLKDLDEETKQELKNLL